MLTDMFVLTSVFVLMFVLRNVFVLMIMFTSECTYIDKYVCFAQCVCVDICV